MFDETGAVVYSNTACGGPKDHDTVNNGIVCLTSDGVGTPGQLHAFTSATTSGQYEEASGGPFNHEARVDRVDPNNVLSFVNHRKRVSSVGLVLVSQRVRSFHATRVSP